MKEQISVSDAADHQRDAAVGLDVTVAVPDAAEQPDVVVAVPDAAHDIRLAAGTLKDSTADCNAGELSGHQVNADPNRNDHAGLVPA